VAYLWASRVFTVTLMMVVPALLGGWADISWGTAPGFTLLGAAVGLVGGISHLLSVTSVPKRAVPDHSDTKHRDPE
jgi:hypothetical protein